LAFIVFADLIFLQFGSTDSTVGIIRYQLLRHSISVGILSIHRTPYIFSYHLISREITVVQNTNSRSFSDEEGLLPSLKTPTSPYSAYTAEFSLLNTTGFQPPPIPLSSQQWIAPGPPPIRPLSTRPNASTPRVSHTTTPTSLTRGSESWFFKGPNSGPSWHRDLDLSQLGVALSIQQVSGLTRQLYLLP